MLVNERVLIFYPSDIFSVAFSSGISTIGARWGTLALSYYTTIIISVNNLENCGLCLSQRHR